MKHYFSMLTETELPVRQLFMASQLWMRRNVSVRSTEYTEVE